MYCDYCGSSRVEKVCECGKVFTSCGCNEICDECADPESGTGVDAQDLDIGGNDDK